MPTCLVRRDVPNRVVNVQKLLQQMKRQRHVLRRSNIVIQAWWARSLRCRRAGRFLLMTQRTKTKSSRRSSWPPGHTLRTSKMNVISRGQQVLAQRGGISGQHQVSLRSGFVVGDPRLASDLLKSSPRRATNSMSPSGASAFAFELRRSQLVVAGGLNLHGVGLWDLHLLHCVARHLKWRCRHTKGGATAPTCPAPWPLIVHSSWARASQG